MEDKEAVINSMFCYLVRPQRNENSEGMKMQSAIPYFAVRHTEMQTTGAGGLGYNLLLQR
jgi:hypothetical protein